MPRLRLAALLAALALAPAACSRGDTATGTTSPEQAEAHGETEWTGWEPTSFERAKQENRIILINVVASWCHWCHVMDEETYGDPEIAALLAEHFVTIRVDSDARPDVAERYREWGWPATAFLTPEAQQVLALRGYKHRDQFEALLRELVADRDAGRLAERTQPPEDPRPVDGELGPVRERATVQLDGFYDEAMGGWGKTQKYPFPGPLEHALVRARVHAEPKWLERAKLTLRNEESIIDPVWGGIYQYSLKGDWVHPHYEKITAIQAGAIENYAMMARHTGDARWLGPALEVAGYMLDMMRAPEGGFYTSQDADLRREGQEPVLGEKYYAMADAERRALGIPIIDRNVYADLNGVMIRALVELYAASGEPEILAAAIGTTELLLRTHRTEGGAFLHGAGDDAAGLLYLRDQAAMGTGLLALYRATGDARWLEAATQVGAFMLAKLEDSKRGGFYAHTEDPAAVGVFAVRRKPVEENGTAARFLVALHRHLDGDGRIATPYREAAERALAAVGSQESIEDEGRIVGQLLLGLESVLEPIVDVTVVGPADDPKTAVLHLAALRYPEPRAVLEQSRPGERYPDIGKAAVYLCTESACSTPITDPARLPKLADEFLAESLPPRPR
jgi:uncharacterized protein YyaL (SSP411 family)